VTGMKKENWRQQNFNTSRLCFPFLQPASGRLKMLSSHHVEHKSIL
jgi:hypothetical protein